jgi:hypothetical protein
MIIKELRQYIVRPALQLCDIWSQSAENLIIGTGLVESGFEHIIQTNDHINGGLGFFQDEKIDHDDVKKWLKIKQNKVLLNSLLAACWMEMLPDEMALIYNIRYAVLICRIHYLRASEALPNANSAEQMAQYHFRWYNGNGLGKTIVERNIPLFQRAIDEAT